MIHRHARWSCLITLVFVVISLDVASGAQAAEKFTFPYYWYGGGTSNCWQTGEWGSTSESCDNVGSGFLEVPGRLFAGGIGQEVQLSTSGDYCTYSPLTDTLNKKDPNNESGATGENVPSPFEDYQEWDGNGNTCQANENRFGQDVRKAQCAATTCGMRQYVSFSQQGYKDQPWSKHFGNPALVVSAEADVQTLAGTSPAGDGYVCPVFQDMNAPHDILEYCMQLWRGPGNESAWTDERIGLCAGGPSGNAIDTVETLFYSGTQFDSLKEGSATTGVASAGWKTYTATITEGDLRNAIEYDRKSYEKKHNISGPESIPELGHGCGRSGELSTEPSNFALIGAELGSEAWTYTELGSSGANLKLHTEYESLPPGEVSTGPAREPFSTEAIVTGKVNPEDQETHYWFEYGANSVSESTTERWYAGSGTTQVEVTGILTFSEPETVYHYRLAAENRWGQVSRGEERTLKTPGPSVTIGAATEINEHTALLTGAVDPHGEETHYRFEYGPTTEYGFTEPVIPASAGAGNSNVPVVTEIGNLVPGTTYHYRIVAEGVGWIPYVYSEDRTFTTLATIPACGGADIEAQGSSLQQPAQSIWTPAFNTSTNEFACSGTQGSGGKPTVIYHPTGSGAGLQAFGAEKGTPSYSTNAFIGTDEAPNAAQKAEIEAHKSGGEGESVETIPILQSAIAVIVHLPEGCTASSEIVAKGAKVKLGRLVLDDKTLEAIYKGSIATWAQLLANQETEGTGTNKSAGDDKIECKNPAELTKTIRPVVSLDHSGTTHIFKEFLEQVNASEPFMTEAYPETIAGQPTDCGKAYGEESKTWSEVVEGCQNQRWPTSAHVLRGTESGDAGIVKQVNDTPSSIGYADLAISRELKFFSSPSEGGGEGEPKFWVEAQDTKSLETKGFYDPSTDGDTEAPANASCKDAKYALGEGRKYPPETTRDTWNSAKAELVQKEYPLCGLTYEVALREYGPYLHAESQEAVQAGRAEERTVVNYLDFALTTNSIKGDGGGLLIKSKHDYEWLSQEVRKKAETGIKEIKFRAGVE